MYVYKKDIVDNNISSMMYFLMHVVTQLCVIYQYKYCGGWCVCVWYDDWNAFGCSLSIFLHKHTHIQSTIVLASVYVYTALISYTCVYNCI